MAEILGGVGTSHVPAIGAAIDHGKCGEPYWQPVFEGTQAAREWMKEAQPDVCIIIYNDHASCFDLRLTPTFALGVGENFLPHDEGYGPRPVPSVEGAPDLAWHIADSLVAQNFDITLVSEMTVDHGLTVPLSILYDQPTEWPCKVIPLCVNVIQHPLPTASRCYALGKALRAAIESHDSPLKVAVIGTGGLSHQLQGERAGLINEAYDQQWLDLFINAPEQAAAIDVAEMLRETGSEGVEAIMWLVMRGCLDAEVRTHHRFYHVPVSNTAYGLVVLENAG